MSLRKFMHERNIYKEEPNFKKLYTLYPEFRKAIITGITGKIKINFKDEESLRVLTKTLLKHDFNLEVEIPKNKLVPALPLRLNYILWIEDLLKHSGIHDLTSVHGIDIGTGAIGIYPLLISQMYKCKMTCSDINSESVNSAVKNINNNNLQDLIKVILVNKESILKDVLEDNNEYTFVMCNPPFFETDKGLGKKCKQEPPRNAPTGNLQELEVSGGEKKFILRLIEESLHYKERIKIYTTMFGQKSSLAVLRAELSKRGIVNSTWTEFCQGFTKRWGIAWSFVPKEKINLTTAPVIRTRTEVLKLKKNKSMEIIFPAKENLSCLHEIVDALKLWLMELKIKMTQMDLQEDDYPCWACQLTAYNNTWSHARRKRRMLLQQMASAKKLCEESVQSSSKSAGLDNQMQSEESEAECIESNEPLLVCTLLVAEKGENDNDDSEEEKEDANRKKMLCICMVFEGGHGGKLSMETLRQYLVNKLNVREFFHKQSPSKPNKQKRKKKKIKVDKAVDETQQS